LTSDRLAATGVTLRWYTRSVTRRFGDEIEAWETDHPEPTGIRVSFGARIPEPDDDDDDAGRSLILRLTLNLERAQVSAEVDGSVKFSFSLGQELSTEHASEFLREQGIPYLIGIERGVLADLTRSVGLPAVMVPPLLPTGLLEGDERALLDPSEDEQPE
jgi:hypothetical protein